MTLILVILLLNVFGIQRPNLAKANFGYIPHFTINVFSPENITYYTNSFTLNFSVVGEYDGTSVRYRLDDDFGTVTNFRIVSREPTTLEWFGEPYNLTRYTIMCDKVFNGLPDGNHSLTVYTGYFNRGGFLENGDPVTVNFVIDTSPPEITNITVRNATYGLKDIPLSFTVNKAVSWMAYWLDDGANVTLSSCNTTLTGLPEGLRTLVIFANDTAGNMGSNTVDFTVEKPQNENFGTEMTVAITAMPVAIVCIALIGLLIYRKKKKH